MKNLKKASIGLGLLTATALLAGCAGEADAAEPIVYEPAAETVVEPEPEIEEVVEEEPELDTESESIELLNAFSGDVEWFGLLQCVNVGETIDLPREFEREDGRTVEFTNWGEWWDDGERHHRDIEPETLFVIDEEAFTLTALAPFSHWSGYGNLMVSVLSSGAGSAAMGFANVPLLIAEDCANVPNPLTDVQRNSVRSLVLDANLAAGPAWWAPFWVGIGHIPFGVEILDDGGTGAGFAVEEQGWIQTLYRLGAEQPGVVSLNMTFGQFSHQFEILFLDFDLPNRFQAGETYTLPTSGPNGVSIEWEIVDGLVWGDEVLPNSADAAIVDGELAVPNAGIFGSRIVISVNGQEFHTLNWRSEVQ